MNASIYCRHSTTPLTFTPMCMSSSAGPYPLWQRRVTLLIGLNMMENYSHSPNAGSHSPPRVDSDMIRMPLRPKERIPREV